MRLKKQKKIRNFYVKARCSETVKNALQCKANIYTDGNLSEYLIYAGLNFIPGKEDFEEKKKGRK